MRNDGCLIDRRNRPAVVFIFKTFRKMLNFQTLRCCHLRRQGIEIVASGVSSMRNLSTMVTRKLDEIHIAPGQHRD